MRTGAGLAMWPDAGMRGKDVVGLGRPIWLVGVRADCGECDVQQVVDFQGQGPKAQANQVSPARSAP